MSKEKEMEIDEKYIQELVARIKKITMLEPTFKKLNEELRALLKTKVIHDHTPLAPLTVSTEIHVGKRKIKDVEFKKGNIVCEETAGYYDKIIFKLHFPGISVDFIDSATPWRAEESITSVETLEELLKFACNITLEDLDKIYQTLNTNIAELREVIDKLKTIIITVQMIQS
jgi:hypothetical protein